MTDEPSSNGTPSDDESDPTPERAEELLRESGQWAELIRTRPDLLRSLAPGFQALREGFGEFLTANDRGASRVKDTADKLIASINDELARGGLSPQERARYIDAQERALRDVRGSEKEAREANERFFTKATAVGLTIAVGAVALGYLAKEGKLPALVQKPGS